MTTTNHINGVKEEQTLQSFQVGRHTVSIGDNVKVKLPGARKTIARVSSIYSIRDKVTGVGVCVTNPTHKDYGKSRAVTPDAIEVVPVKRARKS